jgi:regulator of sigma E protease
MDAIASIPLIGGPIATILPFVVVLGIVVAVHEYGHYIVARW